ncbi:hypothetical protein [uncultured Massilia sp.]|uniref:hypothetical protein n=1 Tax=uncultured Massilia sp. TaxID=169973 RepID=UPI0025F8DCF7|nr:hypothetical protein [uncultured Massilia sp.]
MARGRLAPLPLLPLLLLLLPPAGGAAAPPPAPARTPFQARCEEAALGARAGFSSRAEGYRVDNGLSWRTLTTMKRGVGNGLVLGLTRAESRVSVRVDGARLEDADGVFECLVPQVDVVLFYPPMTVYVGSEFAPGTCAYREILAHEMRHLKTYLDWLPKVEERVRVRLGRRFAGKPLYARRGEGRALLQSDIDRNWMPVIRAEMLRVETLQAAIDTPREYARLSKVCQGEVQSIIGSTRPPRIIND